MIAFQTIKPDELVLGDIVVITEGQIVAADIRIIECSSDFAVDQSNLTGESEPVPKSTEITQGAILMEAHNLIFYGCYCVKGNAKGIVHAIGDETFMGKTVPIGCAFEPYQDPMIRRVEYYKSIMSCFICVVSVVFFILVLLGFNDMIIGILWVCLVFVIILAVYSFVGYFWSSRYRLIKSLVNDGKLRIKSDECLQVLRMMNVLCTKAENVLLDWNGNVIDGLSELIKDIKKLNVKLIIFCENDNEKNLISNVIGADNIKLIDWAEVDLDYDTFTEEQNEWRDIFNGEVMIVCSDDMNGYQRLKVVSLSQSYGDIVGCIGNKLDDAPSLKKSDIGISFNDDRYSTDVAKEAADAICLSSSLHSVITSIKISKGISLNQ